MASIFPIQVAGHGDLIVDNDNAGKVLKPLRKTEHDFYESLIHKPEFSRFTPQYYGVKQDGEKHYIILEDLTHGYQRPSVMDIKVGTLHYLESYTPEKKAICIEKCRKSTSSTLGFRICGMAAQTESDSVKHDKKWGRSIPVDRITSALDDFFKITLHKKDILTKYIIVLEDFFHLISTQKLYRFVSTSLLFVYEGDTRLPPKSTVQLIDFVHTLPIPHGEERNSIDNGFIFGMENLIQNLKLLRDF
eukprot:TRINITY_DN738_c0_g1_i1.p1 TRINITY_DN738_c0_g1~~TRINITY_DN738_c0_g1_i1.p1  ORF type:complete len:247 (-),score=33.81 TRINITY_DN738_c0_g1_i1:119-859(-)